MYRVEQVANQIKGVPFKGGINDCYGAVHDLFLEAFGIKLPFFARPDYWWDYGLDILRHTADSGADPIGPRPRDLSPGDVLVMSVLSHETNHLAVYLGNNHMYHHLYDGVSRIDVMTGGWRRRIVQVYRHPEVYAQVLEEAEQRKQNKEPFDGILSRKIGAMRTRVEERDDNRGGEHPSPTGVGVPD